MLDVHAPEHPIHGIREFLIHLFTITVGLLIALGLENLAEWRHHVHLRNEADANIVSELRDNSHGLTEVMAAIPQEEKKLKGALSVIQQMNEGKTPDQQDIHNIQLGMNLGLLEEASWQTANSTGALSYMEYAHVKRYSSVHALQQQFSQLQQTILAAYLELQSFVVADEDPTKLSTADRDHARVDVQQTLARLEAMRQIGNVLQQEYEKALKPE